MHKWVGFAFFADFGGRAVTRKDDNVIAEREQFLFKSPEQRWRVTPGQVPSPHASGKKNVPANQEHFGP